MGDWHYWTVNLDTKRNRKLYGDIHAKAKAYCKEHGLVMADFVSALILEFVSRAQEEENAKGASEKSPARVLGPSKRATGAL